MDWALDPLGQLAGKSLPHAGGTVDCSPSAGDTADCTFYSYELPGEVSAVTDSNCTVASFPTTRTAT